MQHATYTQQRRTAASCSLPRARTEGEGHMAYDDDYLALIEDAREAVA
jgi:hypothetical protein